MGRSSLGWRFAWGMAIMLLPLVLLAGVAGAALRSTIGRFGETIDEATEEMVPLLRLETQLQRAEGLAYRAELPGRQARYAEAAGGVDRSFEEVLHDPSSAEYGLLRQAQVDWRAATDLLVARDMRGFAARMAVASARLRSAGELAQEDVALELSEARQVHGQAIAASIVVCVGGVAVALWAGRRLARSVLGPVRSLKAGAERLGRGELGHRIGLDRPDELGDLGRSFDTMAGRLQESAAELVHRALHDSLTGLGNRTLLMDRVGHALAGLARREEPLVLLVIDLDNFKTVNDSLGHVAGDQVLATAAERLRSCLRPEDTAARLGGDEFGVLLEGHADAEEAQALAERINQALRARLVVQAKELFLQSSIGIVIADTGDEEPEVLLRDADLAMYRAKQLGKGRWELFEPGMHAAMVERLRVEGELRRALEREELLLEYQPIVELATQRVVGAEALLRWRHPELGTVPPGAFVSLAEDLGVIIPIGAWVLERACQDAAGWVARHHGLPFSVSVNVSARQLQDARIVEHVGHALVHSGLEPNALVLEITETAMMQDVEGMAARLEELKGLGVRVAVDDFGTGYSSLSYLRSFPVDVLKIDKTFIDPVGRDGDDPALAEVILGMARVLGLRTVAEGIEHAEQAHALLALGCHLGQGYHFSRPVSAATFTRLLGLPAEVLAAHA